MLVPMGSLSRALACPDRKFGLPVALRLQLTSGLVGRTAASLPPDGCLLWAEHVTKADHCLKLLMGCFPRLAAERAGAATDRFVLDWQLGYLEISKPVAINPA